MLLPPLPVSGPLTVPRLVHRDDHNTPSAVLAYHVPCCVPREQYGIVLPSDQRDGLGTLSGMRLLIETEGLLGQTDRKHRPALPVLSSVRARKGNDTPLEWMLGVAALHNEQGIGSRRLLKNPPRPRLTLCRKRSHLLDPLALGQQPVVTITETGDTGEESHMPILIVQPGMTLLIGDIDVITVRSSHTGIPLHAAMIQEVDIQAAEALERVGVRGRAKALGRVGALQDAERKPELMQCRPHTEGDIELWPKGKAQSHILRSDTQRGNADREAVENGLLAKD